MSTILTTIDGSAESKAILPAVARLAKEMKARVQLLTVVSPVAGTQTAKERSPQVLTQGWGPGVSMYATEVYLGADEPSWAESRGQALDRIVDEGRTFLEEAARPLKDAGIEVDMAVVIDPEPADAIVAYAKKTPVDVIAMATHGRSGLNQLVQGSVASAVVRSGVAPTLLVRPRP
jgi:nucleotide-binding universal stress UspA family protein